MAKQKDEMIDFVIPGQEEEISLESVEQVSVGEIPDKSKMTLFWLLQHYNKDNAAVYKAQKAEKKKAKAAKKGKKKIVKAETENQVQPAVSLQAQELLKMEKDLVSSEEDNFGKTVFIERDSRPGLADASMPPKAALECLSFGQTVALDKLPFVIGRSPRGVNLCIADNKTVGRIHAVITYRSGSYYIKDKKSLNHVYLDGKQILPETEVPLKNHMKIILGSEQFIFHVSDI